jgi:hypothetical protein
MLVLILVSCADTQTTGAEEKCAETLESVAEDDSSLGFTAADVLDLLGSNLPTSVVWDEHTLGAESASLALTLGGLAGSLAVVTRPEDCGVGEPALRVPVEMSMSMDDGYVVGSGTVAIDAYALALDSLLAFGDLQRLPVVLEGDYADDFEAYRPSSPHGDQTVLETYVSGIHAWDAVQIDIAVDWAGEGNEMLWRGHWVLPPE